MNFLHPKGWDIDCGRIVKQMELKVQNSYHIRINKDAPSDFSIQELERLLKAESNLYIRFVLKQSELISFIYDDHKIKDLKKQFEGYCEIKQSTVNY